MFLGSLEIVLTRNRISIRSAVCAQLSRVKPRDKLTDRRPRYGPSIAMHSMRPNNSRVTRSSRHVIDYFGDEQLS